MLCFCKKVKWSLYIIITFICFVITVVTLSAHRAAEATGGEARRAELQDCRRRETDSQPQNK